MFNSFYSKAALFAAATLPAFSAMAQDEMPEDSTTSAPLVISGFVDAYYQVNFAQRSDNNKTSFTNTFLADNGTALSNAHNSFNLGMANIILSKEGEKSGFVADVGFGPRAVEANLYSLTNLAAIKQLYVNWNATDKLTFTLGNFGTHVGYEIIDAPGNFNYSTSYMFSNGPFYHTGLKADYAFSDKVGFMLGVFNDTDAKLDLNNNKSIGAQLALTPNDDLAVYFNYLGGTEGEDGLGVDGHQGDITATYNVSDDFMLGLNTTYKMITYDVEGLDIDNQSWFGAALYANYKTSDKLAIGFRGEYFDDVDNVNGLISDDFLVANPDTEGSNVFAATLSANIFQGDLTIIPEVRFDFASEDIFFDEDGDFTSTNGNFLIGVYYAF